MWFIPLTSVSCISTLTINKTEQNVKRTFTWAIYTMVEIRLLIILIIILNELNSKPFLPYREISIYDSSQWQVPMHIAVFESRKLLLLPIFSERHNSSCNRVSRRESKRRRKWLKTRWWGLFWFWQWLQNRLRRRHWQITKKWKRQIPRCLRWHR